MQITVLLFFLKKKRHTVPFIIVRDPVAHEFLFKQNKTNRRIRLMASLFPLSPFNCPLNKRLNGAISFGRRAGSWENVVCMLNYSSYRPVRETQTREQITIPSVPLFFYNNNNTVPRNLHKREKNVRAYTQQYKHITARLGP